jgi:AAA domain
MRSILDEAVELNPGRDPDVPQLQDWIPYQNKFMRFIKLFEALPVNIIFTALQMDEENEDGEKVVLPMLQGKGTQYSKKVASTMTSFGRMTVQRKRVGKDEDDHPIYEEMRVIQWRATKTVMAKDRTRCLEPRTVIGSGKLNSLKDVRELLEAGPKQPAATRVPDRKRGAKRNSMALVTAAEESADEAADMISSEDE